MYHVSCLFMCICVFESRIINDKVQRTLPIIFNHFNKKVDQPNQPKTVFSPNRPDRTRPQTAEEISNKCRSPQLRDVINISSVVQRNEIFSCKACGGFSSDSR